MVIGHKYRYVFVQTMKTASTAIAAELCENYGGEMVLDKHASIDKFRAQATEDEKTYFSFAGVRNPLDVAVSRFELRKRGRGNQHSGHRVQTRFIRNSGGDFNKFFYEFLLGDSSEKRHDIGIVPLNWRSKSFQSIDHIYHYEDLQREFATILEKTGIEQKRELPLNNKTEGKADFLSYYDEACLQAAYRVFFDYMYRWGYNVPNAIQHDMLRRRKIRTRIEMLRAEIESSRRSIVGRTIARKQTSINNRLVALVEELTGIN
jgi:hypothetical protein